METALTPRQLGADARKQLEQCLRSARHIHAKLETLKQRVDVHSPQPPQSAHPELDANRSYPMYGSLHDMDQHLQDLPHLAPTLTEALHMWPNRFMVHSPHLTIDNAIRDVLLKYHYSSRRRRGYVYRMTSSALKFIRELEAKQAAQRRKLRRMATSMSVAESATAQTPGVDTDRMRTAAQVAAELADEAHKGGLEASTDGEPSSSSVGSTLNVHASPDHGLPSAWSIEPNMLVQLIRPQVCLRAIKDESHSCTLNLIVTRVNAKVYEVIDPKLRNDPVNSTIMHRTFGELESLQAFFPHANSTTSAVMTKDGFVPLEVAIDRKMDPVGFDRVVPRVSAALRYDKFNRLRISKGHHHAPGDMTSVHVGGANDACRVGGGAQAVEEHVRTGTDAIHVHAERPTVLANPEHYAAIYTVATQLLLYTDPEQKDRAARLDEHLLVDDIDLLSGQADAVHHQQTLIREQELAIRDWDECAYDQFDESEKIQIYSRRADVLEAVDNLNLLVDIVTAAQSGDANERAKSSQGHILRARADEVIWHMLGADSVPFVKMSGTSAMKRCCVLTRRAVKGVQFHLVSRTNATASNRLVVDDLEALCMRPEGLFSEIVSKLHRPKLAHHGASTTTAPDQGGGDHFVTFIWDQLPPVGGISVVETFSATIHPLKLQIEHEIGTMLYEYLFQDRVRQREAKTKGRIGNGGGGEEDEAVDSGRSSPAKQRLRKSSNSSSIASSSIDHLSIGASTNGNSSPRRSIYGNTEAGSSRASLQPPAGSSHGFRSTAASIRSAKSGVSHALRHSRSVPDLIQRQRRAEDRLDAKEMCVRAWVDAGLIRIQVASLQCESPVRHDRDRADGHPAQLQCVPPGLEIVADRTRRGSQVGPVHELRLPDPGLCQAQPDLVQPRLCRRLPDRAHQVGPQAVRSLPQELCRRDSTLRQAVRRINCAHHSSDARAGRRRRSSGPRSPCAPSTRSAANLSAWSVVAGRCPTALTSRSSRPAPKTTAHPRPSAPRPRHRPRIRRPRSARRSPRPTAPSSPRSPTLSASTATTCPRTRARSSVR